MLCHRYPYDGIVRMGQYAGSARSSSRRGCWSTYCSCRDPSPDLTGGPHGWFDPGCVVKGGLEEAAGASEPPKEGGHSEGATEGVRKGAGEVRGGDGTLPYNARGEDVVCDPACAEELYRRQAARTRRLRYTLGCGTSWSGSPTWTSTGSSGNVMDFLKEHALTTEANAA